MRADASGPRPRLGRPMSAPDYAPANGHARGSDGPVTPPQNLEAEQSVLGAVLLSDTALPALIIDERLQPGGLLPRGHGVIFTRDAGAPRRRRAGRRADARRAPQADGPARRGRRPRDVDLLAAPSPPSATCASTRDRPRERDAPPAAARVLRDPGQGPLARGPAARARRPRRAHDPRGRPRGLPQGLPLDRRRARRGDRQARELSREGKAITGTASGFEDLDDDHRRLPARQPDHPGRAAVDGEDRP